MNESIGSPSTASGVWSYKHAGDDVGEIIGYQVRCIDDDIGKVDQASLSTDDSHIVVDTGFWIFGKKRLIPAGVVIDIDHVAQSVRVNMTKDQIKHAPEYVEHWRTDSGADWRDRYTSYFDPYRW